MRIRIKKFENGMITITLEQFISSYMNLYNDTLNLKYLVLNGKPILEDEIRNFIEINDTGYEYYVAIDEREFIVGIMIVKTYNSAGIEIQSLVVDGHYRKKGIGFQFLTTLKEYAKVNNYKSLYMKISSDNKPMLLFAIKYDFKLTSISYHQRFDGEDILHFAKYLV